MRHFALKWVDVQSYFDDQLADENGESIMYTWWGNFPRGARPAPGDVVWILLDVDLDWPLVVCRGGIHVEDGTTWVMLEDMVPLSSPLRVDWIRPARLRDELRPDRRTAFLLTDELAARLEKLWGSNRLGLQLRHRLTAFLDHTPNTEFGTLTALEPEQIPVLGSPVGPHEVPGAWLYAREGSSLAMLVAVYANFSNHDILCLVREAGTLVRGQLERSGPSIQLNGLDSYDEKQGDIVISHHGLVTVSNRIAREDLFAAIRAAAPAVADSLGLRAVESWPFEIGSMADPAEFLDRLFEYGYCIEQAKRSLRGDPPLPEFGRRPKSTRPQVVPASGQGYMNDSALKRAIEDYAMDIATAQLKRMGYDIKDVSRERGTLDLLCSPRSRPGQALRVEVKGTQSDGASVIVTAREVARARSDKDTALFVVAGIVVTASQELRGGTWKLYRPWDLDRCTLTATQYKCELSTLRPSKQGEVS